MTTITHGTQTAYSKHGCRCTECRAWKAAKERAYRARRREREGKPPRPKPTPKEKNPVGSMVRVSEFNKPAPGTWLPMDEGRQLLSSKYPEFAEEMAFQYDGEVSEYVVVPMRRSTDPSKRWFVRVR